MRIRILLLAFVLHAIAVHGLHKINILKGRHRLSSSHGVKQFASLETGIQLNQATTTLMQSQVRNTLGVVITWQGLFEGFQAHGCPLAFHGGAACSLINNKPPRDNDLDYGCTKSEVVPILRSLFPGSTVTEPASPEKLVPHNIDPDFEIEAKSWFTTQAPEKQEFTANMLRIDPLGREISGYSAADLEDCRNKVINIPVPIDNSVLLNSWASQYAPLLAKPTARVWKLFAKGFSWKSDQVKLAWHSAVQHNAQTSPDDFPKSFSEATAFYLCQYISSFQVQGASRWDPIHKTCNMDQTNIGSAPAFAQLVPQCRDMRNAIVLEAPDYLNKIREFFVGADSFP